MEDKMPDFNSFISMLTTQNIVIAMLVICILLLLLYAVSQRVLIRHYKRETDYEIFDLRDQNNNFRKQLIHQLLARTSREIILRNSHYFIEQYKNLIRTWEHLESDEAKLEKKWSELTTKYPHFFNFSEYEQGSGTEVAMAHSFIEREQEIEELWAQYQDMKLYESILIKKTSFSDYAVNLISDTTLEVYANDAELAAEQNTKMLLMMAISEYETARKHGAELTISTEVQTANYIFKVGDTSGRIAIVVYTKERLPLGIISYSSGRTSLYSCDNSSPPKRISELYEEFDIPTIFSTRFSEYSFEL